MAQSFGPRVPSRSGGVQYHRSSWIKLRGAILAVVSSSIMSTGGMPTTTAGWLVFASTVLAGIGWYFLGDNIR